MSKKHTAPRKYEVLFNSILQKPITPIKHEVLFDSILRNPTAYIDDEDPSLPKPSRQMMDPSFDYTIKLLYPPGST